MRLSALFMLLDRYLRLGVTWTVVQKGCWKFEKKNLNHIRMKLVVIKPMKLVVK